jgi:hypothetical protein
MRFGGSALTDRLSNQSGRRRGRVVALVALVVVAAVLLTADNWLDALGSSLVCEGEIERSEVTLIENLDHDYLSFERAAQLLREGWTDRVLVPVRAGREPGRPGAVAEGIVHVMARIAPRITGLRMARSSAALCLPTPAGAKRSSGLVWTRASCSGESMPGSMTPSHSPGSTASSIFTAAELPVPAGRSASTATLFPRTAGNTERLLTHDLFMDYFWL